MFEKEAEKHGVTRGKAFLRLPSPISPHTGGKPAKRKQANHTENLRSKRRKSRKMETQMFAGYRCFRPAASHALGRGTVQDLRVLQGAL
jgi:hypothetical protein